MRRTIHARWLLGLSVLLVSAEALAQSATPTNPTDTGNGTTSGTGSTTTTTGTTTTGTTSTGSTVDPGAGQTGTTGTTGTTPGTLGSSTLMVPVSGSGVIPPAGTATAVLPEVLQPHPGGLTADSVASLAVQTSFGVRASEAGVAVAQAQEAEAGRQMVPSLNTSFRYTRLSDYTPGSLQSVNFGYVFGDPTMISTRANACFSATPPAECYVRVQLQPAILDQLALRITLTVPLTDIPLRLFPFWKAAGEVTSARQLDVEATKAQVGLQAREAFYEYMRAQGQKVVTGIAVESVRHRRDDVARAAEVGTVPRVELLRLEASLADLQRVAVIAENNASFAEASLRLRMHLPADQSIVLGESLETPVNIPGNVTELIDKAIASRPELQSLAHQQRALDSQIFATRVGMFPSIVASANLDYANPNSRFFPQTQTFQATWDATISVSWSPSAAFVADATAQRLGAQQAQLRAQEQATLENFELEIRSLWAQARAAEAQLEASRASLAVAEENFRVRRERRLAGAGIAADVYEAESDLLRARIALVNAGIDLRLAAARLRKASGEREEGTSVR